MKAHVSDYFLYRWRYIIGYLIAAVVVTAIFVFAAFYLPNGLRVAEKATAIASGALSYKEFAPESAINLPYLGLQRAAFEVFGISTFTIKLPSIVLGIMTVLGIFLLIKEWFRKNVGITTGLIATTMPAIMFASQDGTPTILMFAVSIWLLLSATHVTRRHAPRLFWKIMTFALLGINLYIPLGVYLDLAILTTLIFHPHVRLATRRMSLGRLLTGGFIGLIVITPLIYSVVMNIEVGARLIGVPGELPSLQESVLGFGTTIFGNYGHDAAPLAPPLISLGILALVIIGVYRFITIKHTARSYIIWFWTLTLIPLIYLNQNYIAYIIPLTILMIAMGLSTLMHEWYRLFPRNPYARIVGLMPLAFIVGGIAISGLTRYELAYNYSPSIAGQFDNDIVLVEQAVAAASVTGEIKPNVVVNEEELPFYALIALYNDDFTPSTTIGTVVPVVVRGDYVERSTIESEPTQIFTSPLSEHSDRFYLYTSL